MFCPSTGEDADLFANGGVPDSAAAPAASSSGLDEFDDFSKFGSAPAAASTNEDKPSSPVASGGMDAFPSLDMMDSSAGTSGGVPKEVRVTGHAGTGDEADEEREKFESAFPDIQADDVEAIAPSVRPCSMDLGVED